MKVSVGKRTRTSPPGLVGLLLECHDRIRHFISLAREIGERPDALPDEVREACNRVHRYFDEALPLHVADEEESILPRLLGHRPDIDAALNEMNDQHRRHVPMLESLLGSLESVREAPEVPSRRSELAEVATRLQEELHRHLLLEETAIFPVLGEVLSPELEEAVIGELRMRRRAARPAELGRDLTKR